MNLRNYTSSVPAGESIRRIEELLVEAGASHIAKTYEDQIVTGVMFQIEVNGTPLTFRLPAKVRPIQEAMRKGIRSPRPSTEARVMAQAERTAWKLVYEWVAIQLSMIRLEQAEITEIFLPYLWNPVSNTTVFAVLKEAQFNVKTLTQGERKPKP